MEIPGFPHIYFLASGKYLFIPSEGLSDFVVRGFAFLDATADIIQETGLEKQGLDF